MTNAPPTDIGLQALIKQAQKGDTQAFQQIYEMHIDRIYPLCLRLCADKSQAEDATQEVFIQVWKSIAKYNGDSRFSTWLHSVATNVTISYLRRQKNWWQRMFSLDESDVLIRDADIPTDISPLEKHLTKLPERARIVFVLHAIDGYRHEEIAKLLKIAVGTSKAQFHRAKQLLEERLNHGG
ncbi:MAG: RNA polymerase sigma factor [Pseudomonadota bacterium]